jgi:hypothetical protein
MAEARPKMDPVAALARGDEELQPEWEFEPLDSAKATSAKRNINLYFRWLRPIYNCFLARIRVVPGKVFGILPCVSIGPNPAAFIH